MLGATTAILVLAMVAMARPAQGQGSTALINGSYRRACPLGTGDSVVVMIDVTAEAMPLPGSRKMWGGDEERDLTRHVRDLRVRWAGREVSIPLSAFADLGQPDSMTIAVLGSQSAVVLIKGGEESTGYVARLLLERGVLKRRRVSLRGFEREFWEETRYSGPVETN
ncbi:MAG: hypothetical protein ABL977_03145 [Candidatus Eisenbacteria bacterium]